MNKDKQIQLLNECLKKITSFKQRRYDALIKYNKTTE